MRHAMTMYSASAVCSRPVSPQLELLDPAALLEHVEEHLNLPARSVPVGHPGAARGCAGNAPSNLPRASAPWP